MICYPRPRQSSVSVREFGCSWLFRVRETLLRGWDSHDEGKAWPPQANPTSHWVPATRPRTCEPVTRGLPLAGSGETSVGRGRRVSGFVAVHNVGDQGEIVVVELAGRGLEMLAIEQSAALSL